MDLCARRPTLFGLDPPAVAFFYSPDRSAKHPQQHLASHAGLRQADAYARV